MGTWNLVALESAPAGDDRLVPVKASGTLTCDEFGNLTIDAHTTDPAAPVAAWEVTLLSFRGRAVIETIAAGSRAWRSGTAETSTKEPHVLASRRHGPRCDWCAHAGCHRGMVWRRQDQSRAA
jgi:hypothetical protein